MSFISRIMRFLFWLLVLSWSVALVKRGIGWLLRGAANTPEREADAGGTAETAGVARRLVRDPVCGVHVAEVRAIPLREGGELLHFCSATCRDEYLSNTRKFAANG